MSKLFSKEFKYNAIIEIIKDSDNPKAMFELITQEDYNYIKENHRKLYFGFKEIDEHEYKEVSNLFDPNNPTTYSTFTDGKVIKPSGKSEDNVLYKAVNEKLSNYRELFRGQFISNVLQERFGIINDKIYTSTVTDDIDKKIAYITQTTLSVDDTKEIIKILKNKFPDIKEPMKEDICYATTNRQLAVKNIAKDCDMFFVIGSRNSSNSARLVEVAKKSGCKNSELIFYGKNAPLDKIKSCKTIGLSSGASAPEELVQNFISEIRNDMEVSIEEVVTASEKVVFKLPKELN